MRRSRGCLAALALTLLLATAGGGVAWWWIRTDPAWYAPPDPADPAVAQFAETVEYRVVEEMQRIRPASATDDGSWTLRVRDAQVNAWLSTRLPDWLARDERGYAWPANVGLPQLHFRPDGIDVGVEVRAGALTDRVVVARLTPTLAEGRFTVRLARVGIGRVGLAGQPLDRLIELLEDLVPRDVLDDAGRAELFDVLDGTRAFEGQIPLADGRVVEVTGVRLGEGMVDITSLTRFR